MRFGNDKVKLTQIKRIVTKNGKDMTFVKLLDETDYSSEELPLSNNTDVGALVQLNDYRAVLTVDNGFRSVDLFNIK